MSNRQYITKAIVCGSKHNMTSDKSYLLFTEDIGMLWATARSVRMEKSKQRYALQDFSIIRVSLVQGKSVWRIGSVEAQSNSFFDAQSRVARGGVAFIIKSLRRYIQGEMSVQRAFTDVCTLLPLLSATTEVQDVQVYQQLFLLRLLSELGYITASDDVQKYLDCSSIESAVRIYDKMHDETISQYITQATQVSHL